VGAGGGRVSRDAAPGGGAVGAGGEVIRLIAAS
jgi:hypothetical protein